MQKLDANGTYVAKWAQYEITNSTILGVTAQITTMIPPDPDVPGDEGGEETVMMAPMPKRNAEEAIQWAAAWLANKGSSVFVDGRSRSLADFLAFERVT